MDIILYYAPTTCALVPYVTLTEAQVEFEVRRVNFGKQQHMSPEFLAVNPKHKVPVLVIDGKILTENVAMHLWLSQQFPAAKILPIEPWDQVKAVSLMSWCSSGIHPHLSRTHNPFRFCDIPGTEASIRDLAKEFLFENFEIAENLLGENEFFFDHFTAVDAHFFWCFRRATQFGHDLSTFKHCVSHFNRMKQRASFKNVIAFEEEVMAEFAKAA
ncbi:MAG: glutathione S-transferase family protein [Pseudomonadota bacterium]|nr:glutathione S-transferase family protein [Pseudomonadota bacterium]